MAKVNWILILQLSHAMMQKIVESCIQTLTVIVFLFINFSQSSPHRHLSNNWTPLYYEQFSAPEDTKFI